MERDQASASTHLESVGTPSKAAVAVVRGQQSPQSCGVSRTVPSRGVRHSPPVVSDVRLRSPHRLVTLARAPREGCTIAIRAMYECSAGERNSGEKRGENVVVLRREETGDVEGFYT